MTKFSNGLKNRARSVTFWGGRGVAEMPEINSRVFVMIGFLTRLLLNKAKPRGCHGDGSRLG